MKKVTGILTVLALFCLGLNGQPTRNDVINSYNTGAKAMQTDVPAAIAAFENVVTLSDQVGETAADLKQKAVQVLPGLYVKAASNALTAKKPAQEVIQAAKKALANPDSFNKSVEALKLLDQHEKQFHHNLMLIKEAKKAIFANYRNQPSFYR